MNMSQSLLGTWKQVPPPVEGEEIFIEFRNNGELQYRIELPDKTQKILMRYRVDGNKIISNQPSHPKEEQTNFRFENKNFLVLVYDGSETTYEKQP